VIVVCLVGNGVCDELVTRSEEPYRECASNCVCVCACVCVRARLIVCHVETSRVRQSRPVLYCYTTEKECFFPDEEQSVLDRFYSGASNCGVSRTF